MHDRGYCCDTRDFTTTKAEQTISFEMDKKRESSSNAEKMKKWREKKTEKKREADKKYYERNRERKIAQVQEYKVHKTGRANTGKVGVTRQSQLKKQMELLARKRKQEAKDKVEERKNKIRQQTRERVRRLREKRREEMRGDSDEDTARPSTPAFTNRMAKTRALKKTVEALPKTPEKKAELLKTISSSPRTRKILEKKGVQKTPEEIKETAALRALAADISEGVGHVKKSGSNDRRAAYSAFKMVAFGQNVAKSRAKKSLSKLVNVGRKGMRKAVKERQKILSGEKKSWLYLERKTRGDAVGQEVKQLVFNFWTYEASRPTGDKKDVIRKRIGKKQHIEHAKHVLEKTQTEAFLEFQAVHPDVKIKQRKFESLKPFFIRAAKEKDRRSCLCRKHVEAQIVFKDCMRFRKSVCKRNGRTDVSIPSTLTEAVNLTLCGKSDEQSYHNLKCLKRECDECGVDKFVLLPEELSEDTKEQFIWKHYAYILTGKFLSNGQEKKKIALITKQTPPKELFTYFQGLLKEYPYHSFMAKWQRDQMDNLIEHLPLNEVVCVHDYSEGYSCRQQDELQSEYFDVAKVSLHITILYRHAVESIDGKTSTENDPQIIKEHLFVISDDEVQDYHSVHKAQELVKGYLEDQLKITINKLHEFTDGCAAQYKSRHCIGDLSCCLADYGFNVQRSYFETSHAKGEQDAAGANVKQKVSQAVLRKTAVIRNAKEMKDFLAENFTTPAASSFASRTQAVGLSRRVFFYVPTKGEEAVVRRRQDRTFKALQGIRKLHCVKTTAEQGRVFVRDRTCYCIDCIIGDEKNCSNKEWVDDWREVRLERESSVATTRQAIEETEATLGDTAVRIADLAAKGSVVAIAAADDPDFEYYLLKVTSDGLIDLKEAITDDYGCTFPRGSVGLRGNFFIRENIIDMTYKLDEKKIAFVLAGTVRHVCGELKRKRHNVYKVSLDVNEEIIASL